MNQENLGWELPSGTWRQDKKNGYTLVSRNKLNIPNHMDPTLVKQLLNLPVLNGQCFPVEFKFHPDSGTKLERRIYRPEHYWLGAFGNSTDALNQPKEVGHNGLQLSRNLHLLKKFPEDPSSAAPVQIRFDLAGSFEFLSICIGTPYQQLIALNKNDGALYLLNEQQQIWKILNPVGSRLSSCPEALLQSWQAVSFYNQDTHQHQLYVPTTQGLACITINGLEMSYKVEYSAHKGICLSQAVYWNKHLVVAMFIDQHIKIVDILSQQVIDVQSAGPLGSALYFEKMVYDPQCLIWVGSAGQLILEIDAEHNLSSHYEQWLPSLIPDFRFGAPYLDRSGKFYQLCQKNDDGWYYVELNAPANKIQIKSSFRFTTGRVKYSFQDPINGEIWSESANSAHDQKIVVPLIEDAVNQRILGFRFETDSSQSIDLKLNAETPQDIMLFLDSHDHPGLIHRVQVKKPLDSRFFYHQSHVYFYNPSLNELLGWEIQ
ncbi:hypothetical protein EC844_10849 [Acinetobacter calcoaceticus]|uniref:Uncharacterized protein n=1 Tax=Acinetobacter calcoaceticus TaxID=471 RepID=A0A4R1XYQ7_ACICA|nr:hypothetical protein EC844_10849 [Acinetobacter calcoaceticus]